MKPLRFHPAARKELAEALDWYLREAGSAIAASFLEAVQRIAQLIVQHPELGRETVGSYRQLRLDKFPYTVAYALRGDAIIILAVAHQSRQPEYWLPRLSKA